MAFKDFPEQESVVALLQRSLQRGRLGHAYLFSGASLGVLESLARTLAKTLTCEQPPNRGETGLPLDSCDTCLSCRKIENLNHPDVLWIRPESKTRQIRIEQVRDLLQTVYLKPTQAPYKVVVMVAADRLNTNAANAFLKTLEEPPADSILILLSTEPQRLLDTILSRCLRLSVAGADIRLQDPTCTAWLGTFANSASTAQKSLLGRYKLLSVLLNQFAELKQAISDRLSQASPIEQFEDIDPALKEKWEGELAAAIESEYRRQRADFLTALQWWLRDVWITRMQLGADLFAYPQFASQSRSVADRLSPSEAMENLHLLERTQHLLATNVQEALALEVGLLKLRL